MNIQINDEKASDPSKDLKSSDLRTVNTPSATSFFFKANPKQILNTVKKALSSSNIKSGNDAREVTGKEDATCPEEEHFTVDKPCTSSDIHFTRQTIEITSDEDVKPDLSRKRSVVIDLSDEEGKEYRHKSKSARIARKRTFVRTEKPSSTTGKRATSTSGTLEVMKAPSSQETTISAALAVSHPSSPEIDPLLLKYASPSKAAPSLPPTVVPPSKRYKMTIHDDFPYHFGDRSKHTVIRTITSSDSIWAFYRRHCEEKRLSHHSVVLTYSNARIFKSATPASLGIVTNSFTIVALPEIEYRQREEERVKKRTRLLDTLLTKDNLGRVEERSLINMSTLIDQPASDHTIQLSFRSSSCSSELWSTYVVVDQPLTGALPELCSAFGLASDVTPRLFFDGTLLDASRSPQQLQLEDDDLIDICLVTK